MSTETLGGFEGSSSERGRGTHIARTLLVVIPAILVALALTAALAGSPAGWPLGTARANTQLADGPAEGQSRPAAPPTEEAPTAPVVRPQGPTIEVEPAPPVAARLVAGPVERVIDTRQGGETTVRHPLPPPDPSVTGLALSVSLVGAERAGTVTVEGSFGSIDVLTVDRAAAGITTGVIVVPGTDPSELVNPSGGYLVVDLVGRFVASGPSSDGRLITVDPVRVARLVTATDGREAEVDLNGVDLGGFELNGPEGPVSAVLVAITADVGDDGGRIGIGPAPGQLDQVLMWGPPTEADRQRSGVVLVAPGADGRFALRYDGGSLLDVDLVAYVTGAGAPVASEGLFVPASSITTVDRVLAAGTTVVDGSAPGAASAFVGLRAAAGAQIVPRPAELARDLTLSSGQTIGTVLPVGRGPAGRPGVVVSSRAELEARLQIIGHFLAPSP